MRLYIVILLIFFTAGFVNAQEIVVRPEHDTNRNVLSLYVYNPSPCPVTLTAVSTRLDTTLERYLPKDTEKLLASWQTPPKALVERPQKMFSYNLILGNPNAIHDDRYQYELPYPVGKSYELIQGNKSAYSHNQLRSQYAFDFAMPVGSFIAAARGGVVGYVIDKFDEGGDDPNLMTKSNRIMICHDDGTVGAYGHLRKDGAFVEVGDMVYAGQVIGFSGNTGYTAQPHLHFVVLKGGKSVPIRFRDQYTILYEGEMYEHEAIQNPTNDNN
jgi:murein DD-endopeptidase MepM/ murein hydrolase activator NlpD